MSPALKRMQKKSAVVIRTNIHLGHFKDVLIQHLEAMRMVDREIIDIDFGLPSKGCVPLEIYVKPSKSNNPKKEVAEDQVSTNKRGKKR